MSTSQWQQVITDAAAYGVRHVTFIGGEPTLRPDLPALIAHATDSGLDVEVFTNLAFVPDRLWSCFTASKVSIATSFYSADPGQHAMITGRDTLARTRDNIARALRLGLDVRVGLIGVLEDQQAAQARAELIALGVRPARIGYDRLRQVGRGIREPGAGSTPDQLCGRCGRGRAAVSPDGDVWPCVFSRWMNAGSVKRQRLAEILNGSRMREFTAAIPVPRQAACSPECTPATGDGSDCAPAETDTCGPSYCNPI